MANIGPQKRSAEARSKLLHSAAKLFLKNGYQHTKIKDIEKDADVGNCKVFTMFGDKETLLAELVAFVLEGQFKATKEFLKGKEYDEILYYAAETTLQLYMVESSENIRDLYAAAYSMKKSSDIIQHTITGKLENIFKEHLPHLTTQDFYMLEIASGGIMRGFMTIPCDMWFTMEKKIKTFLETTFLVYRVPDEKINEAIEFVSQFDYPTIAKNTIDNMLAFLESRT